MSFTKSFKSFPFLNTFEINYSSTHLILMGIYFLKRFYLCMIFSKRGREGEREGEKHQCVVVSCEPSTGDLACNPDICPDWESNQWPFGSQAGTQFIEHTGQGGIYFFFYICKVQLYSDFRKWWLSKQCYIVASLGKSSSLKI